jgi:hypothetical protein
MKGDFNDAEKLFELILTDSDIEQVYFFFTVSINYSIEC